MFRDMEVIPFPSLWDDSEIGLSTALQSFVGPSRKSKRQRWGRPLHVLSPDCGLYTGQAVSKCVKHDLSLSMVLKKYEETKLQQSDTQLGHLMILRWSDCEHESIWIPSVTMRQSFASPVLTLLLDIPWVSRTEKRVISLAAHWTDALVPWLFRLWPV